MIRHALRSLTRDPFNTIVMIVSLTISILCSGLILSFLLHETGTDSFHRDKDRIYALKCDDPWLPNGKMYYCRAGSAEYMKENFSSVEDYCRVNNSNALKIVVNEQSYFDKPQLMGVSSNFFGFFSYDLVTGDPATVLESENNIVISTDLAEKYFNSDALGKVISLVYRDTSEEMTVTGLFRKKPENTQLNFDMVRRIRDIDSRCYIKLAGGSDPAELENIFSENRNNIPVVHMGKPGTYYLTPLAAAYFDKSNIFQMAASITLIICSIVIMRQINYIIEKPIGLDKNVIEVKIPGQYNKKAAVFKDELLKNSSVSNVSVVGASPLLEHMLLGLRYMQDGVEKEYVPSGFNGDENYLDVLSIKLLEGSGFRERSAGSGICIINQSFARLFPDRKLVGQGMPGLEENIVTGIVEDFHYSGFEEGVGPAFVSYSNEGGHLLVKPAEGRHNEAIKIIGEVWEKLIPDFPVNTESIAERLIWFHRDDMNFRKLLISCSLISLFLSMIGLLAVTYQKAKSRTREIGIRKINGATFGDILVLINKGFLKWIAIAFMFAVPASWFAMLGWLEGFAYRTGLPLWIFFAAGGMILLVNLVIINWQVWNVARQNPVKSLRYE